MSLDTCSPEQTILRPKVSRYDKLPHHEYKDNAFISSIQTDPINEYMIWNTAKSLERIMPNTKIDVLRDTTPEQLYDHARKISRILIRLVDNEFDSLLKQSATYRNIETFIHCSLNAPKSFDGFTAVANQPMLNFCRGVKIPNIQEITNYLSMYPDMNTLVQDICSAFLNKFKGKAQLSLELFINPEYEDQYLTLYVRQDEYEVDIMESIDSTMSAFDERLSRIKGWFLATTDFQPPR